MLNKRILGVILIALLSVVFTVSVSYFLSGQRSTIYDATPSSPSSGHTQTPEESFTPTPHVESEIRTIDEVSEFFSNVVGLELPKYTLVDVSPVYTEGMLPDFRVNYTTLESTFGGIVNVSVPSYRLQFNESNLDVKSMFYNGQLAFLRIESEEKYVFSEIPENDVVRQAQIMLEGYQTYVARIYADDGAYLEPMLNILRSGNYSAPENRTLGEIGVRFFINGDVTRVRWVYSPNGVTLTGKYLELSFENGTFHSFADTWRHYNKIEISKISAREAFDTALEAAQKVEFTIVWGNGSVITYKSPDLSNAR